MERFRTQAHNHDRVKGERALGANASGFHASMQLFSIVLQPTAAAILRFVSASFQRLGQQRWINSLAASSGLLLNKLIRSSLA